MTNMTGQQLLKGRKQKGWNQEQAALKLGVSQPYLSLLEKDKRRVPSEVAHKAARVFNLSYVTLPLETKANKVEVTDNRTLATDLASLGYPPLSHLKGKGKKKNPAGILLSALKANDLESRLVEALPWVLLTFPELNWQWLINEAKVADLQNKLGFITNVARRLAERLGKDEVAALLKQQEKVLEHSRLMRETTLCHDSMTETEKRWLKANRSKEAKTWRLLTDLSPEHLSYYAT